MKNQKPVALTNRDVDWKDAGPNVPRRAGAKTRREEKLKRDLHLRVQILSSLWVLMLMFYVLRCNVIHTWFRLWVTSLSPFLLRPDMFAIFKRSDVT